jgi:hypothetical protein
VTRAAFTDALELDALHGEFFANERIQFHAAGDKVAPRDTGRFVRRTQLPANRVKNFRRKKSDLAFVVVLEIEEPVADQTFARNALDLADFNGGIFTGLPPLVAKKIVAGRNENPLDLEVQSVAHRLKL